MHYSDNKSDLLTTILFPFSSSYTVIYLQKPRFKSAQDINRRNELACERTATSERLQNVPDQSVMFDWWLCTQRSAVLAGHI